MSPTLLIRKPPSRISLLLLIGLCVWPGHADSQEVRRRWLAEPILSVTIADREGDLFGDPWRLISDPGGGFLIAEAATIHAFHVDGTKRWSVGRSGQGPGEFRVIEDVKVAPDGRVLALDREQPRVTVFDGATGEFVATVLLRREVARTRRIIPARGALARVEVHLPQEEGTTWWTVSEKGEIVDEVRGPSACSQDLTCESSSASDSGWGSVQAYRWSSQMVFHEDVLLGRRKQTGAFGGRAVDPRRVVEAVEQASAPPRTSPASRRPPRTGPAWSGRCLRSRCRSQERV